MTVENPQRASPDGNLGRRKWKSLSRGAWRDAAVFSGIFGVVFCLQIASGAYRGEFGGYPDEPAHYVTGLMVRDYIAHLQWWEPTRFAANYYSHYPKVAFGHWPPLLYVVEALWMLVFSPARESVLLELALLTAVLAFSFYTLVRRLFGWPVAAAAGMFLVCLPEIQRYTDEVMAENLLILVSLWGAIYFARYMESERWRDSFWFGIFASLAVLTKGNGWEIAFVPPVAIVLTRRWRLLLRPSFWLPVPVVGLLCVPWQLWSLPMARRGWTGGDEANAAYTLRAMGEFLLILGGFMGPVLTGVALLGCVATVALPYFRNRVEPVWAVMLGTVIGVWTFHVVVPAGIESRKMIVAVPALILFMTAGAKWLADRLSVGAVPARRRFAIVLAVLAVAFGIQVFAIPHERHYGFTEAAGFVASHAVGNDATVLVSSEGDGEGLLISELAMREPRLTHTVLRGTKALSSSDWTGASYKCWLTGVADLQAFLTKAQVGLIVLDTFPGRANYLHNELLVQSIRENPNAWDLLETVPDGPVRRDQVQVWRYKGPAAQSAR